MHLSPSDSISNPDGMHRPFSLYHQLTQPATTGGFKPGRDASAFQPKQENISSSSWITVSNPDGMHRPFSRCILFARPESRDMGFKPGRDASAFQPTTSRTSHSLLAGFQTRTGCIGLSAKGTPTYVTHYSSVSNPDGMHRPFSRVRHHWNRDGIGVSNPDGMHRPFSPF